MPTQPGTMPTQPGTMPAQPGTVTGGGGGGSDPTCDVTTLELLRNRRWDAPAADVADLVRRVKNGESEAFAALYDRYSELVHRYVFYRVGSVQVTEDIVSETFLRALRRIGSFRWQGTDIGAWFITIARNLVIDQARSSHTRLEFPTEDILATAEMCAAGTVSGPEDAVITILRNRTLLDAVRALSPDQQECVVLRFLEGLTLRETALAMDRKENAVKALQLRAVRALARHLPPRSELI
jgi:RNA polymerase sigma-70 factor (ECF subfamily)